MLLQGKTLERMLAKVNKGKKGPKFLTPWGLMKVGQSVWSASNSQLGIVNKLYAPWVFSVETVDDGAIYTRVK